MDNLSIPVSWMNDGVAESAIHALYASPTSLMELDAVECFMANLLHTHFEIAISILRKKVSSLIQEPVIDWVAVQSIAFKTFQVLGEFSCPEHLLVLEVLADLVVHSRKIISSTPSSQINWWFDSLLWSYCVLLLRAYLSGDALAVTEDAIHYNLSTTTNTMETDETLPVWLGLRALILADMGRFPEAGTVLHKAVKKLGSLDPHWFLTGVESLILRQTGRKEQALLLLENITSSIANGASHTTRSDNWFFYFLFSNLSSTQLDVGQTQNALEAAERAVIKCRELHLSHPHKFQPRIAVAHALSTLSNCLAAVSQTDKGLAVAREAVAIYTRLPRGYCPWGYLDRELTSKAYYTLSLRLEYRKLVSQAVGFTPSLAYGLGNLASRFWDIGRHDESIAALGETISLLRGVIDTQPHHLSTLGDVLEQLAGYLSVKDDSAEGAYAAASECADIRRKLVPSLVVREEFAEAES
ncbi:hypothetical protein C8J57DRAFT_1381346 [Mycena rebaudengoi]|nr:hypothetical protein C8J57DRAFT_1381346 [Mycena rebaudengoi]